MLSRVQGLTTSFFLSSRIFDDHNSPAVLLVRPPMLRWYALHSKPQLYKFHVARRVTLSSTQLSATRAYKINHPVEPGEILTGIPVSQKNCASSSCGEVPSEQCPLTSCCRSMALIGTVMGLAI